MCNIKKPDEWWFNNYLLVLQKDDPEMEIYGGLRHLTVFSDGTADGVGRNGRNYKLNQSQADFAIRANTVEEVVYV